MPVFPPPDEDEPFDPPPTPFDPPPSPFELEPSFEPELSFDPEPGFVPDSFLELEDEGSELFVASFELSLEPPDEEEPDRLSVV